MPDSAYMTTEPGPNWQAYAKDNRFKFESGQWEGPCPACGEGENRLRINLQGKAFCRVCCPDGRNIAALRRLEEAAGVKRELPAETEIRHYPYFRAGEEKPLVTMAAKRRIDNGKKTRKPWRTETGIKKPPEGWPLYNLPALLEERSADLLVVEGEETANAAERMGLPAVAVTSFGGAGQAHHTDWTPAKGLNVFVWGDADAAGRKYADDVARLSTDAGAASVRIVDTAGLPEGWDLADKAPPGFDIQAALDNAAPYEPGETEMAGERVNIGRRDKHGLARALDTTGWRVRWNLRDYRHEWSRDGERWHAGGDRIDASIRQQISDGCTAGARNARANFGDDTWRLALNAHLYDNEIDPFRAWLESLPAWDGQKRLDGWLGEVFRCDGPLAEWAARFIFMGAVARTLQPGLKLDEMPVLIGPQDAGKSTALAHALPPDRQEWFSDGLNLAAPDQRRAETLQGKVICEAAEMAGGNRAELASLKAFLSRTDDGNVRLAYRRDPQPTPRRAIIVGTADHDAPLPNDPAGLRRFVAVEIAPKVAGVAGVRAYLDGWRVQLWAEALHRVRAGEEARVPDHLKSVQADTNEGYRRADRALEDRLAEWLECQNPPLTISTIALAMDMPNPAHREQSRLVAALQSCGWKSERTRINGKQSRRWWPVPSL